jgi:hypothetical protein
MACHAPTETIFDVDLKGQSNDALYLLRRSLNCQFGRAEARPYTLRLNLEKGMIASLQRNERKQVRAIMEHLDIAP